MKTLFTLIEILEFENKYRETYRHYMRYGQALFFHFRELSDDDFEGFNMYYEESEALCTEHAWKYVEQSETGDKPDDIVVEI